MKEYEINGHVFELQKLTAIRYQQIMKILQEEGLSNLNPSSMLSLVAGRLVDFLFIILDTKETINKKNILENAEIEKLDEVIADFFTSTNIFSLVERMGKALNPIQKDKV